VSWSTIQEGVRTAVATALQLEDFTGADALTPVRVTEWANRNTSHRWVDGPWADLTLGVVQVRHTDEIRYEDFTNADPELATYVPTTGGQRRFTVTVQVCTHSQEPGEASAGEIAGRLRTRMRRLDVLRTLQTAGVALMGIGATFDGDFPDHNNRMVSCSITELWFGCVESDTDESEESTAWIGHVAAEGTLTNIDGTEQDIVLDIDAR
jgi:hypothetical protein